MAGVGRGSNQNECVGPSLLLSRKFCENLTLELLADVCQQFGSTLSRVRYGLACSETTNSNAGFSTLNLHGNFQHGWEWDSQRPPIATPNTGTITSAIP